MSTTNDGYNPYRGIGNLIALAVTVVLWIGLIAGGRYVLALMGRG